VTPSQGQVNRLAVSRRVCPPRPGPGRGRPRTFSAGYLNSTRPTFTLSPDGRGGADVHLADEGVADGDVMDMQPGWVSVLIA